MPSFIQRHLTVCVPRLGGQAVQRHIRITGRNVLNGTLTYKMAERASQLSVNVGREKSKYK